MSTYTLNLLGPMSPDIDSRIFLSKSGYLKVWVVVNDYKALDKEM